MMKSRTSSEWEAFFEIHPDGIIAQRVLNYEEVLDDEQALVNGYIVEKDIPHVGRRRVAGIPVRMSELRESRRTCSPTSASTLQR